MPHPSIIAHHPFIAHQPFRGSYYKNKKQDVEPMEVLTSEELATPVMQHARKNSSIGFNKEMIESLPTKTDEEVKEHEELQERRKRKEEEAVAEAKVTEQRRNSKPFSPSWGPSMTNSYAINTAADAKGPASSAAGEKSSQPRRSSVEQKGDDVDERSESPMTNGIPKSRAKTDYDEYEPVLPRGVTYLKGENLYQAGIMVKGRFLNLGKFDDVEEAAEAFQRGSEQFRRK